MESNTHSTSHPTRHPTRQPDELAVLATAVEDLAAQDLDGLMDAVRAERVLELRGLLDRLEGQWLKELAGVDAHGAAGAAGAVQAVPAGSTAGWLRARLRIGPAPPTGVSGPPGPCSAAPHRNRPGGDRRPAVPGPRQRARPRHPRPPPPGHR